MRPQLTERLYYRDPALLNFEGMIMSASEQNGRYVTVLDRSAFYPTSGGQQCDIGYLNGVAVIDVIDADSEVHHITSTPVGGVGEKAKGAVDPMRRLRHRQQHTAQHILSQVFVQLFGLETVSVHLGDEYGGIELETAAIDPIQLAEIERRANDVVQSNWPVDILFVSGEEVSQIPLRKVPTREGTLRVIKIGEFDWSACGGTHCNSTAEIGLVKIIGTEKMRGRVLVKFLAGNQALQDYNLRFDVTDTLSKSLTCHVSDLPTKVGKLSDENKFLRKEIGAVQKELIPIRAKAMADEAQTSGDLKFVSKSVDSMDASAAGLLGAAVADLINGLVVLIAEGRLLIAVGQASGLHAGDLAKKCGTQTGLRGGGNNKSAQLGGADSSKLDLYTQILLTVLQS